MVWEIIHTEVFEYWYLGQDCNTQDAIIAATDVLSQRGPGLGRPLVDQISHSRHKNMKELRPMVGGIRILFAFDPRRRAILLLGGDKTNRWQEWYKEKIPLADDLFDDHLSGLAKEG